MSEPRYWSCPRCGIRREYKDLDGYGIGMCWRCKIKYDPNALIICGLTGNEPLPFKLSTFEEHWDFKHS